jgi:glutamate-1-semialdehyde 2,1-aminomutase
VPHTTNQAKLMAEAKNLMPQGVAENYRFWGEDKTVFVHKTKGCEFWDVDGKKFVDFRLGYGPIILGYRDSRVDAAVCDQIKNSGTLSGFATALDAQVVLQVRELCPNIHKMRFANSGTEAVMGAIRTARGFTKRDRVVIVEGSFHGLNDEMMWKSDLENWTLGSLAAPKIIPFGAGIPQSTRGHVDIISFNDDDMLENVFKKQGQQTACVLLEPIIGNAGSISARPAWLQRLRDLCSSHGALLIIDEVKSGFRVAKGGAQQLYGIYADLTTYAKAMGNGYPVAAFGGRADVMDSVGNHPGGVVHGGTYTGNLVSLRAANACLDIIANTPALQRADAAGSKCMELLHRVFTKHSIPHAFAGPPAMFGIHLGKQGVPHTYRDWKKTMSELYVLWAWRLIAHGVMLEPDSREPWFLCEAHSNMDFDWLESVCDVSMREACDALARARRANGDRSE